MRSHFCELDAHALNLFKQTLLIPLHEALIFWRVVQINLVLWVVLLLVRRLDTARATNTCLLLSRITPPYSLSSCTRGTILILYICFLELSQHPISSILIIIIIPSQFAWFLQKSSSRSRAKCGGKNQTVGGVPILFLDRSINFLLLRKAQHNNTKQTHNETSTSILQSDQIPTLIHSTDWVAIQLRSYLIIPSIWLSQ